MNVAATRIETGTGNIGALIKRGADELTPGGSKSIAEAIRYQGK
jgi:hypothetical protein